MTLAHLLPWKRNKPAADPMQADTQTDPRTEDALDAVARKYKSQADLWKHAALNTEKALFAARSERDEARGERDYAREKLRNIAAMETPGSVPAAKRMARVAREGLPEYAERSEPIAA